MRPPPRSVTQEDARPRPDIHLVQIRHQREDPVRSVLHQPLDSRRSRDATRDIEDQRSLPHTGQMGVKLRESPRVPARSRQRTTRLRPRTTRTTKIARSASPITARATPISTLPSGWPASRGARALGPAAWGTFGLLRQAGHAGAA
jgi:hypothetical protein